MAMEMVGEPLARSWKGERGEWYVAIQAGLFLLLAFGPRTASWLPAWPGEPGPLSVSLAAALMIGGFAWIIAGAAQLAFGRSLSPLPYPNETARLLETGVFGLVRHPMYCGGIWAAAGWGLWTGSLLTLGYAAALTIFFDVKASREERWLAAKFPGYASYRRRVGKLIPYVY